MTRTGHSSEAFGSAGQQVIDVQESSGGVNNTSILLEEEPKDVDVSSLQTERKVTDILRLSENERQFLQQQDALENIVESLLENMEQSIVLYQEGVQKEFLKDPIDSNKIMEKSELLHKFLQIFRDEVGSTIKKSVPELPVEYIEQIIRYERRQKELLKFQENFSHDFCISPMNPILGFTDLLGSDDHSAERKKYYGDIVERRVAGLLDLFKSVLCLAREPHFVLNRAEDLEEEKQWGMLDARAKSKGIELVLDAKDVQFFSDKEFIFEILRNLVSNSIKFQDGGKIVVRMRENDAGELEIQVKDSGRGIDADNFEKIQAMSQGGKLVQLSSTTGTKEEMGTGMGLQGVFDTSRRIFAKDILVETEKGKGTTFVFTLSSKDAVLQKETEKKQVEEIEVAALVVERRSDFYKEKVDEMKQDVIGEKEKDEFGESDKEPITPNIPMEGAALAIVVMKGKTPRTWAIVAGEMERHKGEMTENLLKNVDAINIVLQAEADFEGGNMVGRTKEDMEAFYPELEERLSSVEEKVKEVDVPVLEQKDTRRKFSTLINRVIGRN